MEDLELGSIMSDAIGIEATQTAATEEKLGRNRLGEPSIFSNLGVTIVLATLIFLLIILILVLALWVCKKAKVDDKWRIRLMNAK